MGDPSLAKIEKSALPDQEIGLLNQRRLQVSTYNDCYGWIVLCSTALSSCLYRGLQRSLGVLFNELKHTYHTDSKTLTSIMGLILALDQFIAPVSSYLVVRFSCRLVAVMGSLCLAGGLIFSSFVKKLGVLFLTMGVMIGMGVGLCDIASTVIISYYFKSRPTAAQGVRLAGATLGGVIMPLALRYLLYIYYLNGTLLLSGGLMLNMLAFGMLYHQPKVTIFPANNEKIPEISSSVVTVTDTSYKNDFKNTENITKSNKELHLSKVELELLTSNKDKKPEKIYENTTIKMNGNPLSTPRKCCHFNLQKKELQPYIYLLSSSIYYMYIYSSSTFISGFRSFIFILPAHVEDHNLDKTEAALLLTILSINDLIGRLTFGWIMDGLKLNRRYCYVFCSLTFGIATLFAPFYQTFTSLAVFISGFGLLFGCAAPIFISLYIETFGQTYLPAARGVEGIFGGVLNLCISYLVGYLADKYDSFTPAFYFLGCIFISSSLVTLLYPFAYKWDSKRIKLKATLNL